MESLLLRCSPLSLRSLDCADSHGFDSFRSFARLHAQQFGDPSYTPMSFDLYHYRSIAASNPTELKNAVSGWLFERVLLSRTSRTLAAHCPHLTSLSLAGCGRLTNAGLKLIGRSLTRLQVLYICRFVSMNVFQNALHVDS